MASFKEQKYIELIKQIHDAIDSNEPSLLQKLLTSSGDQGNVLELCQYELRPFGTALHHAAGVGNHDVLDIILRTGIDVNTKQHCSNVTQGQTSLHIAALAGKNQAVSLLLSRGANVNAQESEGQTALHCACSGNDVNTVRTLVEAGAVVNMADDRKEFPIQRSILRSTDEVTRYLIESGADLNIRDSEGQSLLHYAVEWEKGELVELLLTKGLSANSQDNDGCSPLHLADNEEIMNRLVQNGGDVNLRDNCGRPPIARRIDVAREEYRRISAVLEKQLSFDVPSDLLPTDDRVKEVQDKFNKMAVSADASATGGARADVMSELLQKSSETEAMKPTKPSPLSKSGVLDELKLKQSATE